jgi:hypothetical protein
MFQHQGTIFKGGGGGSKQSNGLPTQHFFFQNIKCLILLTLQHCDLWLLILCVLELSYLIF